MTSTVAPSLNEAITSLSPVALHRKADSADTKVVGSILEEVGVDNQAIVVEDFQSQGSEPADGRQDGDKDETRGADVQYAWQNTQLLPGICVTSVPKPLEAGMGTPTTIIHPDSACGAQGRGLETSSSAVPSLLGLVSQGTLPIEPAKPASSPDSRRNVSLLSSDVARIRSHTPQALEVTAFHRNASEERPNDGIDERNEREPLARSEQARNLPPPDGCISSVSQITPVDVKTPSPARQLLQFIESSSVPVQNPASYFTAALPQVGEVKVLRMKLTPEALGDVELSLRRSSSEMRIHITVTKKTAAELLQGDIDILRDRIGGLLPAETSHTITISVVSADTSQAISAPGSLPVEPGIADSGQSFLGSAGGDRPTPHKEDRPLPHGEWDRHDQDTPVRPNSDGGLVV